MINKIKEEYPDRIMTTYSVVPSQWGFSCIVEPYNAALSLNHLIKMRPTSNAFLWTMRPCTTAESLGSPYSKTYPLPSLASDQEQTLRASVHSRERSSTPERIMHTSPGSYPRTEPMFAFGPRELDCGS